MLCRISKQTLFILSFLVVLFIVTLILTTPNTSNGISQEKTTLLLNPPFDNNYQYQYNDNDFKLFNITLNYILNSYKCEANETTVIMIVTSYFGNIETRSAMRRSFPANKLSSMGIRRVFLLGMSPKDNYTSQESIVDESRRFKDIVQGNFIEAYRNLTYKHAMGIKWVNKNCENVRYVIKMDDDIVVNMLDMVSLLRTLKLPNVTLAGYILRDMKPIREPANKWYVPYDEYKGALYPQFVSGWFYVTTPDVYNRLEYAMTLNQTNEVKYFWIDDVYVTGILAKLVKARHYDLSEYFAVHSEYIDCCVMDLRRDRTECGFLVGPNGGDNNLFYDFNEAVKVCHVERCKRRTKPIEDTCVARRKTNLGFGNALIRNYRLH